MWQKELAYNVIPVLTKTGKERNVKVNIHNPTDIECWFSFAKYIDLDGLVRMLNRGFNINCIDESGRTIGILACELKSKILLEFFIKQGGDLFIQEIHNQETIFDYVSYPSLNSNFFKLIWNNEVFNKYINTDNNMERLLSVLIQSHNFPLVTSDKNLIKIKYLLSIIDKSMQHKIKIKLLNIIEENKLDVPKIVFFLKGKEKLFFKLKNKLIINSNQIKLRGKI